MMAGEVTYGAGEAMGLEVMLFADKEKYFLTSAFFEGFKVSNQHATGSKSLIN